MLKLGKINIKDIIRFIGNALFLMLIFVILIDPANTLLHKKDILFILLTAFCIIFYKPDFSKLPLICMMFLAVLIPWLIAAINMRNIDTEDVLHIFKSISPIILLLWVREFDLLNLSRIPTLFCCILMDTFFCLILIFPEVEGILYNTDSIENESIFMTRRWFWGHEFFLMYLKSTVAMFLVVTFYFYKFIDKRLRTFGSFLTFIFILFYFLFSGTRSTMLIPFFIIGICLFSIYRNNPQAKRIFYPLFFIGAIIFVSTILILASETQEYSNAIKYGHIVSYIELFENNPWILITGQGPGANFFTEGFGSWVFQTEWSYLDLIRWFGLFSLPIIGVFAFPLISLWKYRADNLTFSLFWTYVAYLAIAGTNPLLLSSTGMLALLIAYSYREKITKQFSTTQ